MAHLTGISDLRILDVTDTFVTDFGVQNLKESLPGAKVLFNKAFSKAVTGSAGIRPDTNSWASASGDRNQAQTPRAEAHGY
jgi:hypothetical protein